MSCSFVSNLKKRVRSCSARLNRRRSYKSRRVSHSLDDMEFPLAAQYISIQLPLNANLEASTTGHYFEFCRTCSRPTLVVRRADVFFFVICVPHVLLVKSTQAVVKIRMTDMYDARHAPREVEGRHQAYRAKGLFASYELLSSPSYDSNQDLAYLKVSLRLPRRQALGLYDCRVSLSEGGRRLDIPPRFREFHLYVIANPLLPKSGCYLPDVRMIGEYVHEERGFLATGSNARLQAPFQVFGRPWNFGQHHPAVLRVVFLVLSRIPYGSRQNLVALVRELSRCVQKQDQEALLIGRWDGNYTGGQAPGYWLGSLDVFLTYLETGAPVRYGQCWVFAGILCTICRSLGIPARPITNFTSIHTMAGGQEVDQFYSYDGELIDWFESTDSVWNFHIWVEVYLQRSDIGNSYDGWQVIDGSPFGFLNPRGTGPCSAVAVREHLASQVSNFGLSYDTAYVIAEVSARINVYYLRPEYPFYKVNPRISKEDLKKMCDLRSVESDKAGKDMYTKKIGDMSLESVVDQYKPPPGLAIKDSRIRVTVVGNKLPSLGQSLTIQLKGFSRRCRVEAKVQVVDSYGRILSKKALKSLTLTKHDLINDPAHILIEPDEYVEYCRESFSIEIRGTATEGGLVEGFVESFTLLLPRTKIRVQEPATYKVGDPICFHLSFANPLRIGLSDCKFRLEGSVQFDNRRSTISHRLDPLGKYETAETYVCATLMRTGPQSVWASFSSKELANTMTGETNFLGTSPY